MTTPAVLEACPGAPGPPAPPLERPVVVDRAAVRAAVLDWFDVHGRRLAIRSLALDPWAVLVGEVMAQQTQIGRVEERLPAFLATFPTPGSMAAASPADVLRAWRGLGYNRRAVALQRAATAINAGGGRVPDDLAALQALPGVGPYTARAVAAIAFGRPVGAVDVNVRRVVGRLLSSDPSAPSARSVQAAADHLVDPARPAAWTHAVMDLGATVCRPSRPACPSCPLRPWCATAAGRTAASSAGSAGSVSAAGSTGSVRSASAVGSASAAGSAGSARPAAVPFERTTRWLRGRIVDRLRDAPSGTTVPIVGPLGSHGSEAVAAAVGALVRDGLVELDAAGRASLPRRREGGVPDEVPV